jgi:hypothetical protein
MNFDIEEGDRQAIILALAKLSFTRPGWHPGCLSRIAKQLGGLEMYEAFRDHGADPAWHLLNAAEQMDWQQVVLNGGPPCFHLEDGRFCGRAQRWEGHDEMHKFISLADLFRQIPLSASKSLYREGGPRS